jgi:hypothetical protein
MRVLLQISCQIQRTSFGLRHVKSGPCQVQRYCNFADSAWNIQLNVSAFPFEIFRQFDPRCTVHLLPKTAHINRVAQCQLCTWDTYVFGCLGYLGFSMQLIVSPLILVVCRKFDARCTPHSLQNSAPISRFLQCQLCDLPNTELMLFWRFWRKYSIERIIVSIGDMSTIRVALYPTFAGKYSAPAPVFITWTPVEDKSNVIPVLHIQDSIFYWTYLRCHWWYLENSLLTTQHNCSQMQRTPACLRYVSSGPCQIHYNCGFTHLGLNIQLHVSPLLLVVCRQFDARYTPHSLPNTAHINRFAQCQLCVLSNTR